MSHIPPNKRIIVLSNIQLVPPRTEIIEISSDEEEVYPIPMEIGESYPILLNLHLVLLLWIWKKNNQIKKMKKNMVVVLLFQN